MAFCPNCGAQAPGRFCPNCGTDIGAAAPGAAPGTAPPPPPGTGPAWTSASGPGPGSITSAPGLNDNVASALCYLGWFVTGIIFLLLSPYNRNRTVRFHAWQSIFLALAVFVIDWVVGIAIGIMHMWVIGVPLMGLLHLLWFVLWLYMMFSAYNNRMVKLPVVGDFAEKQA